jgi:hypothetical protein
MPDENAKPTKEQVRAGMEVFFGEHATRGTALEDKKPAAVEAKVEDKKEDKKEKEVPEGEKKEGEKTPEQLAEEAKAAASAATPAKPKRVAKKVTPEPAPRVDDDTVARVASETAARTVAAMKDQQPPAPKAGDVQLEGLNLDAKEKRVIERMQIAGRQDPKFADLAEKTLKFWKVEQDYIAGWKAKHPDEPFKMEDHAEFYNKNEPQFDQDDFEDAVTKAREENIRREAREEGKAEATKVANNLRFETRWRDEAPAIDKVADESVAELITDIDPELAKLLTKDNEAVPMPEALARITEKDKIVGKVLTRESGLLARMVREVERLDRYAPSGHYKPDPKNPLHSMIFEAALNLEETIAALPKEDQVFSDSDSRTFIRQNDYNAKIQQIIDADTMTDTAKKQALKEFEAKHWTLDATDVKNAVKATVFRRVQEKIAEYREVAGIPAAAAAAAATPPKEEKAAPTPAPTRPKPPTVSGGPGDKTTTQPAVVSSTQETQKQTDAAFFR